MIIGGGQRRGRASRPAGRAWRLVALGAALIVALTAGPGARTAAAETHGKRAEAKAEFEKAQLHYRLGRFEEALKAYTRAYELFNAPALLFNIGQCHKNLQNYERAIFFFQGYLREETNAEKRALAEELITASRAELARQRVEPAKVDTDGTAGTPATTASADAGTTTAAPLPGITEAPPPPAQPPVLVTPSPGADAPAEQAPVYRTWWFWTAVGAGAVAVAAGAGVYYATGPTKSIPPTGSVGTLDRR